MEHNVRKLMMLVGLVVALASVAGCSDDDGETVASDDTTATTAADTADTADTTTSGEGGAPVAGTDVAIAEYAFAPEALTVQVGDTVTWTNDDDFAHGTAGDANEWESGDIEPGATFEQTFDQAGTFAYHCSIHNFMKGEIVVEG